MSRVHAPVRTLVVGLVVLSACSTAPGGDGRAGGSPTSTTTTPATDRATPGDTMKDDQPRVIDERGRRTDLEPLTRRFAALGEPASAVWMSGTVGDGRAVGPTTYFIDAVVVLTPEAAADLRARAGTLTPREADVVEPLRPDLPRGPFTGSRGLDLALSTVGFSSGAAFAADGRTLVLRSLGQG